MKKEDVPQDLGSLGKITKEVCYATDTSGKYTTALSNGWEIKTEALDVTWDDINQKIAAAKEKVLRNEASPILFFMERNVMNIGILSSYTGFFKWQIKRHLKPAVFNKLSTKKLTRYAEVFSVSVDELKTMNVHEE
ncbi:MAG TPA: hypothetical protein VFW07_02950 [Parafilimonas sp.]|nr:hypothetical protein [Parafilimonas sp.]